MLGRAVDGATSVKYVQGWQRLGHPAELLHTELSRCLPATGPESFGFNHGSGKAIVFWRAYFRVMGCC